VIAPLSVPPEEFQEAASQLRSARLRSELVTKEIDAPERIAPHAIAFGAAIRSAGPTSQREDAHLESPEGAGRLILLHDPHMQDEWNSHFRVVCFAQAPLEIEIGSDPFITDVAWSWLVDALDSRNAQYTAIAGTATKTLSTGYGALADQGDGSQIELRASWSPIGSDFAAHAEAWSELLCLLAGLPHEEGVASLGVHRTRKATQEPTP
jgi:hypothetical protein